MGDICPICGKQAFYSHRTHLREYKKCAYCSHEVITRDYHAEIIGKEKEERMEDLKNKGTTVPNTGDPRFPEKPAWKVKDEKRLENAKKELKVAKPVYVAPPLKLDRMGKPIPTGEGYVNEEDTGEKE